MPTIELPDWTGVVRPQRADARRNFDALLGAARAAFAEHGVNASLEDVARRAGVGIGTLYRNFPTRDALIEAVYVAEVERLIASADHVLTLPPWDGLAEWLRVFIDYVGTKRVLVAGITSDSTVLQSCRTAMYRAGEPVLRRAQDTGDARPDIGIEDVVRLVSGVAAVAYPDDDTRDRVIGIAIDGIRARGAAAPVAGGA